MPKSHPQDILIVRNIDVDCTEVQSDILPTTRRVQDEENPGVYHTAYVNEETETDHSKYFEVRWGGQPFRIQPGAQRLMPRFIAEHFAKHLADHILGKRQISEKKMGLISHVVERPKVLRQIILGVQSYYFDLGEVDEGLAALDQVEELNAAPLDLGGEQFSTGHGKSHEIRGEVDGGDVPNQAVGVLKDADKSLDEVLTEAGEQPDSLQGVTRADLIKEAHQLGIPIQRTDTKEQLASKIKAF